MEQKSIKAAPRTETGKNVNRRLRNDGLIPAVLYSHGTSESLKIEAKDFYNLFKGHISESVIFELDIDGGKDKEILAFVKDYQVDPVTGEILHLDLFKVTKGEKIQTSVPVELVGTAAGVKMGGQLDTGDREINVECLPKDLPEKITIDISKLNLNESVHAGDIALPEGVVLLSSADNIIASVHATRVSEEPAEEEAATEETEVEGETAE